MSIPTSEYRIRRFIWLRLRVILNSCLLTAPLREISNCVGFAQYFVQFILVKLVLMINS
jgi:hypothetical protein